MSVFIHACMFEFGKHVQCTSRLHDMCLHISHMYVQCTCTITLSNILEHIHTVHILCIHVLYLYMTIPISLYIQSNGLSLTSLPSSNGPLDGYSQENSQETSSATLVPPVAMKKKMSAPGTLQPHVIVSSFLN